MIQEYDSNGNNLQQVAVETKPRSPGEMAWRRLRKNKTALWGGAILVLLYLLAVFANFFSPYSPTHDEFRSHFYHPPTHFYFHDANGRFTLRPHVSPTTLVDRRSLVYSEGDPMFLVIRVPSSNTNSYGIDTIEERSPFILVKKMDGEVVGSASYLIETRGPDTGLFLAAIPLQTELIKPGDTLFAEATTGARIEIPSKGRSQSRSIGFYVSDSQGNRVDSYEFTNQRFPVQFFVPGSKYNLFGFFQTDIHLFGVDAPAHVFLFGTDQTGRDIFSRILHGARISLTIGIAGVLLTTIFGLAIGGISGYYGGAIDTVLMRFSELLLSIPALYLILTLRNIVPDRLEQSYDRIRQLGIETFAWHNNPVTFSTVLISCVLLLSYYSYRGAWRRSRLIFSGIIIMILAFGPQIVEGALWLIQKVLPGSTHLTSDWTYFLIIVILSTVGWASLARVIRGMVLALREEEYVLAARASGASDARVLIGHILPNTFGYVIVRATLLIPAYILGEVALSFLGVGIQEPIASWGNMLSAAQSVRVLKEFTWALTPGFFLFVTVLAFNFLGDGLRDALDPRTT
jgi:peptide/nickel transport system permease protein